MKQLVGYLLGTVTGFGVGVGLFYVGLDHIVHYRLRPKAKIIETIRGLKQLDGHIIWSTFDDSYRKILASSQVDEAVVVGHWKKLKDSLDKSPKVKLVGGYQTKGIGLWLLSIQFIQNKTPGELIMEIVTNVEGNVIHVSTYT